MTKIFISMPTTYKTEGEIRREQEELLMLAGEYLKEPVSLVETNIEDEVSPLECLGESIKRMSEADCVIFSDCWEDARGCRIEYACARDYGKKILVEHGGGLQDVH